MGIGSGHEHVGAGQHRGPVVGTLRAGGVHPASRRRGDVRADRAAGPSHPQQRERHVRVGRGHPHERFYHRPALRRPLGDHVGAALHTGAEPVEHTRWDLGVIPRVELGCQVGGLLAGGQQGVDACQVALPRRGAHRIGECRLDGGVEGGGGQALGVLERGRRHSGAERVVGMHDVELALSHGQRDVGAGRHRQPCSSTSSTLPQRNRGRHGHHQRLAVECGHSVGVTAGQSPQPPPAGSQRVARGAGRKHRHQVPAVGQPGGHATHVLGHRVGAGQRVRTDQAEFQRHGCTGRQASADSFAAFFDLGV